MQKKKSLNSFLSVIRLDLILGHTENKTIPKCCSYILIMRPHKNYDSDKS